MDHLNKESERLADEKPEEAAVIKEKVVQLTDVWQELKQMVSRQTIYSTHCDIV